MRRIPLVLICLCCVGSVFAQDNLVNASSVNASFIRDNGVSKKQNEEATKLLKEGRLVEVGKLKEQLQSITVKPSLPQKRKTQLACDEVYRTCCPSVFSVGEVVSSKDCELAHVYPGATAFAISEDGLLLTNHHIFESVSSPTACLVASSIDGTTYPIIEVMAVSKRDDIAVVRVDGSGFTPLPISRNNAVGKRVSVISNPHGAPFTFGEGIVTRRYMFADMRRIHISAEFAVGSSGAPVLDDCGNVVGVVAATADINQQMMLRICIPSQAILELLSGTPDSISVQPIDPYAAQRACMHETFEKMKSLMRNKEILPLSSDKRFMKLHRIMKYTSGACPEDPVAQRVCSIYEGPCQVCEREFREVTFALKTKGSFRV